MSSRCCGGTGARWRRRARLRHSTAAHNSPGRTLRHAKNLVDFRPMNTSDFLAAALRNPVNEAIAGALFRLALPDAWIVAGCLVQTVWNVLTNRAVDYGIADYDVFYFDPDTSWQAEDAVIRMLQGAFARLGVTVEARNQARVHLWYGEKHGLPYPPLKCSTDGIDRFLAKTTRVWIRRTQE